MMAILHALKKWHPYLIGRHFKVKTDHDSLKYFLEQRLSSEEQQKWVTKILGYDFEIVYKKGKQNVVADALSRKDEDVEAFLCAISIIQPDWIIEARDEWKNDEKVWTLIQRLQQDSSASDTFTWKNDSLWYKDHLYLCKNSQLKQKVLVGRLVVVIDVNPSHGFWTTRLMKLFGHEGKCTCRYNTHGWIVYIMLFPVVCGTSRGSSWLRRNEFLKMTK
jgi:hypothetical protein